MNNAEAKKAIEAALLCVHEPLSLREMTQFLADSEEEASLITPQFLTDVLREIATDWAEKGIELVEVATGWRFQSRPEMRRYLDRLSPERAPRYSRAALETLSIIAYRQPVTRGDIEDIRGIAVSSQIIRSFEDRGWVETIGHRNVLGRPALLATTRKFLDDLGLQSLDQLPPLPSLENKDEYLKADEIGALISEFKESPNQAFMRFDAETESNLAHLPTP